MWNYLVAGFYNKYVENTQKNLNYTVKWMNVLTQSVITRMCIKLVYCVQHYNTGSLGQCFLNLKVTCKSNKSLGGTSIYYMYRSF